MLKLSTLAEEAATNVEADNKDCIWPSHVTMCHNVSILLLFVGLMMVMVMVMMMIVIIFLLSLLYIIYHILLFITIIVIVVIIVIIVMIMMIMMVMMMMMMMIPVTEDATRRGIARIFFMHISFIPSWKKGLSVALRGVPSQW